MVQGPRRMEEPMPGRAFRFVHAADFHLETPPHGVIDIPDHLREAWIDAAYVAAERVFEAALIEEAEFLLLVGDILDPQQTGPRGPAFLAEQFSRLAEARIAVYWAGGEIDPPDAWPSAFPLPPNVHVFPTGRVAEIVHARDGMPLVRLVGTSRDGTRPLRPAEFEPDPAGLFTIGVAHGTADIAALQARHIAYWALGGRHERATPFSSPALGHDPGSPQGRCPAESGPHGCTVVQVDDHGQARPTFVATDSVRWMSEQVTLDDSSTREDLERKLTEHVQALKDSAHKNDLLVSWQIGGSGPVMAELRKGVLRDDLLDWLRVEHGLASPAAWTVAIEVEPAASIPARWLEQETILGDFLRAVKQYEINASERIDLEAYVPEAHLAGTLGPAASVTDKAVRQRLLREAAQLGIELLGGSPEP